MAAIRFGVFELDDQTGELRRQGRRVHLAAQPFRVLALLVSGAGSIVTREELRRHLWGDDTFVEFDRSLNFCVAEVRAALGDDARSPRFIETIPRRGYRFIADVHQPAPIPPPAGVAWRWSLVVVILLLVLQHPLTTATHTRATATREALVAFERGTQTAKAADSAQQRAGIAALRTATRLDPRFAEAHYALADLYLRLAVDRELPMDAAIAEARLAAERAIALEDVAESRQVLGTIRLIADWDWKGARREFSRAIALEPKWDAAFVSYARLLSASGDDKGAIAAINRAEILSPNCDLILFDAGRIYARARRYEEAAEKFAGAIAFGPPHRVPQSEWNRFVTLQLLALSMARHDWKAAHQHAAAIVAESGASAEVQARFAARDPHDAVAALLRRSLAMLGASEHPIGSRRQNWRRCRRSWATARPHWRHSNGRRPSAIPSSSTCFGIRNSTHCAACRAFRRSMRAFASCDLCASRNRHSLQRFADRCRIQGGSFGTRQGRPARQVRKDPACAPLRVLKRPNTRPQLTQPGGVRLSHASGLPETEAAAIVAARET